MVGYKSRLSRDLERWRAKGIIDSEAVRRIEADVASRSARVSIPGILATVGAILLCFAAMSFVAANWDALSKLTRLVILFGALWSAYGAAWLLLRASRLLLADAAILLGSGLFGANIMLIAQMYHMDGNPPDAVLLWACGVLLAGVLLQSRPALALAVMLFSLWSWWEVSVGRGQAHFPFLLGWAACAIPIARLRWQAGYQLLAIALSAWIIGLGYLFEQGNLFGTRSANPVVVALGFAIVAGGLAAGETLSRWCGGFGAKIAVYGGIIAYAGLFGLQFVDRIPLAWMAAIALFTLGLVIGVMYHGSHSDDANLTRFGYVLLCVELLGLYFKTLGTLIDTALFFLIAGVIVIVMALVAARLNRKVVAGGGAER